MPQTVTDETYDQNGNLVSSKQRQVPVPVVTDAQLAQIKATLKTNMHTFYPGGVPTGTPTAVQLRNWNIAITGALQYLYNITDAD